MCGLPRRWKPFIQVAGPGHISNIIPPSRSLMVSRRVEDDAGRSYMVELHNLQRHVAEMVMEFRPLEYLLNAIAGMGETAKTALETLDQADTLTG